MENSDELIDIIRRSKKSSGWRNLPTYQPKEYIFFYDESNEIIHSLTFYPNEYDIGFNNKRERRIAKEDRERFLEILNYESN